uniref:Uncharacterized protein n=1 Tax=Octopus bimaculoides TaxID=37653 RepID=A0A0L8FIK1_OCTBM
MAVMKYFLFHECLLDYLEAIKQWLIPGTEVFKSKISFYGKLLKNISIYVYKNK